MEHHRNGRDNGAPGRWSTREMEQRMEHQGIGIGNGATGGWHREWSTREMEQGMEHQGSVY